MLFLMGVAFAQSDDALVPRIDAQRFRPSVDGRFTMWTDDAARGQSLRPSFRVLAHYAHEPLVYTFEGGGSTAVVQHLVQTDLIAGFSFDRFRVGAVVPIYALATSQVLDPQAGLGDLALDGKVVLFDGEDAPARLAVQGRLGLPTTTLSNALGARKLTWELTGIADRDFGNATVAVNVGVRGGPNVQLENVRVDDYAIARVGGGYQIVPWLGVGAEVMADVPLHSDAADALSVEWMLNGRFNVSKEIQLRTAFGTGLTDGVGTPDWRGMVGLVFQGEGPRDVDDDGIPDEVDACRDEPEDFDEEDDTDGCPDDIGSVVVQVFDPRRRALVDASIEIGAERGTGGLQATLPAGTYTVRAGAPGFEPLEQQLVLTDEDVNKPLELVLRYAPVPVEVVVRGPDGPIADAEITVDGAPITATLPTGVVKVEVSAPEHRPQTRRIEVVGGVPVKAVFELEPVRLAFLVADDGQEGHVDFGQGTKPTAEGREVIAAAAQLLGEVEQARLRLVGHRTAAEAPELALQRAEVVRDGLVAAGIAAERLLVVGSEEPAEQARVELLIAR